MRPIRPAVLAGALLALTAPHATAQEPPVAPLVLTLPGGTRAQAMGRAGVALTDADAIFHNPALLTNARGSHLSAQRYGATGTMATIATTMSFFGGGVGLGVQWLDYETSPLETVPPASEAALFDTGPLSASEIVATLGYARTYRGFRIGAAVKAAGLQRAGRDGGVAADIGIARTVLTRWTVALAAQHLGPGIEVEGVETDLPRRYTLGAALQGHPIGAWLDLSVAAELPYHEDGTFLPGLGAELSYVPIEGVVLSGRAGVRAVRSGVESPFGAGASLGFDGLYLEYAYQGFDAPGTAHRIGIRIVPQG